MRKPVPPEINNPDSNVLFVARDPGVNEVNYGRPLVGRAGQKFNEGLAQAGIRRKDINITNRVLYKPWNNDFYRHKWEHINAGKRDLVALVKRLQPELVVSMGNEATYDLVAEYREQAGKSIKSATGITDYRGFFFWNESLECWVLPTLHPSSVLYQQSNEFQFFLDMRRVRQWLDGELPRMEPPEPKQIRSPADFSALEDNDLVSFDIETKWGSNHLRVTAFCGDDLQPYYVWASNKNIMRPWLQSDQRKIAHNGKFDRYFLTYKEYMPVTNLTEDTIALHWAMYPELAGKEDTGAESDKSVGGTRITRKGLLFLASMHLNVPWWKDYQNDDWEMMKLCAQDVWVTRLLWDKMYPEAKKMGVLDQYRDNMDLQSSLMTTQHRGLQVDNELRKKRIKTLEERQSKAEAQVERAALDYIEERSLDFFQESLQCKCCNGRGHGCWRCTGFSKGMPQRKADYLEVFTQGDLDNNTVAELKDKFVPCKECGGEGTTYWYEFNLRSPAQVEELIFNELGAPQSLVLKGSYAGQDTLRRVYEDWATQETNRSDLSRRRGIVEGILREYFTAKKDNTQIAIYKRLKPDSAGKIHTELSSYKVVTSRLSSSESFVDKASTNLQNLPKNTAYEDELYQVRQVIVPDPGFALLLCDYAKAEAVIGAADRQEWDHYEKIITGYDVHSEHSKEYFGEVTKAKRNICKEIEYGSAYLATPYTMAARINRNAWKTGIKLKVDHVEDLLDQHFSKHGHREWWDRVWKEGEASNFWLENPFGLRRQFTNPNEHDRHKQMVNWICQSTVASSINKAWIKIWNELDYFGLHELRHQVHDEIVLQVRKDLVYEVARKVKSIMEEPFTMHDKEIYIPVDIEVGWDNWHDSEELEL